MAALSCKLALVAGGGMQGNSMNEAIERDLYALLLHAKAAPPRNGHGKWDCPRCASRARLSVNVEGGLFHCFHAGCNFSGNVHLLA